MSGQERSKKKPSQHHCPECLVAARERHCWMCGEPMAHGPLATALHVGVVPERERMSGEETAPAALRSAA